MIDRQKVIKGLHCCSHTDGVNCIYCPYDISDTDCTALMAMDVLALLKEQEAKAVIITHQNDCCKDGNCPSCGHELDDNMHPKYCGYCGQAVKWE